MYRALTGNIGNEPDNYLTYFKRATAYLSLGRNNAAADDFSTILNLKPDFDKALMQRARIYVKEGDFESAIEDLTKYLLNRPTDKEAQEMVTFFSILFIYIYTDKLHSLIQFSWLNIQCDKLRLKR